MSRQLPRAGLRLRSGAISRRRAKFLRPLFEPLESRLLLDGGGGQLAPAIVVGRMLSAYFVAGVQNHQETITYTVYNEQDLPVTGVLLTTTLEPGVTFQNASGQPDQSGPNLAWSLGTIQAFDRASVVVTVNLASPVPLQLDTGARAYASLNAGTVAASTTAATLSAAPAPDPSLLASTPDANTSDPFVQEEAAKLNYDPTQIFDFLHTQIGYNSYLGSVRGARGTLWSSAGNALDVASLGVALMRASGIPAQYEQGTLSQNLAQQLILSMFPSAFQTAGYVSSGTPVSDPANDPQLLSETESHYWFQFNAGNGMQDADPLFAGAVIGQAFTMSSGSFTQVPDALEEKTEIQLVAEIDNTADALFGLSGLSDTTVLDQTFDDVSLVGRLVSVGQFVTSSTFGAIFTSTTNTYAPYLAIGDVAYHSSQDQIIQGQPFQEVLTNFPLGSQILTGVFLNVSLSGPQGPTETYTRAILDRIGFAARQNGTSSSLNLGPNGQPALTDFDISTVSVLPGLFPPSATFLVAADVTNQLNELSQLDPSAGMTPQATTTLREVMIGESRESLIGFQVMSDLETRQLASAALVSQYFDRPRITIVSTSLDTSQPNQAGTLALRIDLVRDNLRAILYPGQAVSALVPFNIGRGIVETQLEANALDSVQTLATGLTVTNLSAADIFNAAVAQGLPLIEINAGNLALLAGLSISADAKARITDAVQNGNIVEVPTQSPVIDGAPRIAWYQTDPSTGYTIGVSEDGTNLGNVEYAAIALVVAGLIYSAFYIYANLAGAIAGGGLKLAYNSCTTCLTGTFAAIEHNTSQAQREADCLAILIKGKADALNSARSWPGPFYDKYRKALLDELATIQGLPADPSLASTLIGLGAGPLFPSNSTGITLQAAASSSGGSVEGGVTTSSAQVSGSLEGAWSTMGSISTFLASSLEAASGTVIGANGATLGSGAVALTAATAIPLAISGQAQYQVNGMGSLSFYGPASSSLGVSGNWDQYSATVLGTVSISLTTAGMTLNGQSLPAGTYTITTSSAAIAGAGASSSPNFAGSAAINATTATVNLESGAGNLKVGGQPLDSTGSDTLVGCTGTVSVKANGDGTLGLSASGTAANLLEVSSSPAALSTDDNTTFSFQANVQTSLAGAYALSAQAPAGWTVSIDQSGKVTATPAPGLQGGTIPIQIVAQSLTDLDMVAQTTVNVTITRTQPGMTLELASDPLYTIPFNGAELPTSFRASVQNLGPVADTFNLVFSNVPAGFTLLSSATSLTVPAGETGVAGIYLEPSPGQQLPPPGTQLSFTVAATSATLPSVTQTETEDFTVPAIDGITLAATPTPVNAIPGVATTDTLTITNAGNVDENDITLSQTSTAGLLFSGLAPVALAVGRSATETIMLLPDSSTPLNTLLDATITATFGSAASPSTQTLDIPVNVVVPGAAAIASAADAANQLGSANLAAQLSDLSTALTNLVESPTSAVYSSQAQASLTAVTGLLSADPFLAPLDSTLTTDGAALALATTAAAVQAAVTQLGNDLGPVATTLADEAANSFTLSYITNSQAGQPQLPVTYELVLQNTGSQTTTYDLSLAGLPSGVTGMLSQPAITLAPGQVTPGSNGVPNLTVTITSTSTMEVSPFNFTVTATADDAPEITQTIVGSFTVRQTIVQVTADTANPPFTNPGGQVDVQAQLLNAVNKVQQALVSYTVTDSTGAVLFTSQPVATTLNVLTTLSTVDLGNLDTTGFALGDDTIKVTVADASGAPIPGATGTGTLLIGTPITATLSTTPASLPPGSGTVTTTLALSSQVSYTPPLGLVGLTAIGGAAGVAVDGNLAYVGTTGGIDVVDGSNPAAPDVLSTFGSSDFPGMSVVALQVYNNELVVLAQNSGFSSQSLLVYSLATPATPALLGQTPLTFQGNNDSRLGGFSISNNHIYTFSVWYRYTVASGQIFAQFGESLDVDISNPASPTVDAVIYNDPPDPSTGYPDGTSNVWQTAAATDDVLLIGSTTATGATVNDPGVLGIVMVVDTSNPASPSVLEKLPIPGMAVVTGISVNGNQAFVIGPSQNWLGGTTGFGGNVVVATLDLTNPQSPTVISTQTLNVPALTLGLVQSLGNNRYVSDGVAGAANGPGLFVFDASNPQNVLVTQVSVPSFIAVSNYIASGNLLFTSDGTSLSLYNIGQASDTPVTAQVTVPAGNGVSVVPGSFNVAPSETTTNADGSETFEWDLGFSAGNTTQSITWQSAITGLEPGGSATVADDATVQFSNQGTPGTLTLPDQTVIGEEIIGLAPATQTAAPGAPATYSVTLSNPTDSVVTYSLAVQGVSSSWVNMSSTVAVGAGLTVQVPLVLTSSSFAALGDYGFSVSASDSSGATGSSSGDLVLQGTPVAPDPDSHGIVVAITPEEATAGQGTSAHYVVQFTNTGSAADTFTLTAGNLPAGVTAKFVQTSVDVPPGTSNFRDVVLTLTAAAGTAPGIDNFTISATSTTAATISSKASARLTVVAGGVEVSLNPGSGAPGGSFQETVTNTGTTTDTFDLVLAGPAALVAHLGTGSVTLAPGASQVVPISTSAVDFALPGTLDLTAGATSSTNPDIQNAARAGLEIPSTLGVTARFSPPAQTLSGPGITTFSLMLQNTGNVEDSYSVTIVGTHGPVTATLVGLDGSSTQAIPLIILPGFATGSIELETDLTAVGQGSVTVELQSLTNGAILAMATAIVGTPVSVSTVGPEVTLVQRYGYHMMPTTLVLTFDQALDAITADDAHNYRLIGPAGRTIRVKSAVYDPTTLTVTLQPSRRINIHDRYELIVNGATARGVRNTQGVLLDAEVDGLSGSNYRTSITWRNLVLDSRLEKALHKSGTAVKAHRPNAGRAHPAHHRI